MEPENIRVVASVKKKGKEFFFFLKQVRERRFLFKTLSSIILMYLYLKWKTTELKIFMSRNYKL